MCPSEPRSLDTTNCLSACKVLGELPWDEANPLAFHSLTTLGIGEEAAGPFEEMLLNNVELVPATEREARGAVGPLDALAGDDRYLFLSPVRAYRGDESGGAIPFPQAAVAFHLRDLQARGRVGWRPRDLLPAYTRAVRRARKAGKIVPPAALRTIADAWTLWEPEAVERLVSLWMRHLRVDASIREQRETAALAREVWAPHAAANAARLAQAAPWAAPGDLRWEWPFRRRQPGSPTWPHSLERQILFPRFGPELVIPTRLPLSMASFALDIRASTWRPRAQFEAELAAAAPPRVRALGVSIAQALQGLPEAQSLDASRLALALALWAGPHAGVEVFWRRNADPDEEAHRTMRLGPWCFDASGWSLQSQLEQRLGGRRSIYRELIQHRHLPLGDEVAPLLAALHKTLGTLDAWGDFPAAS